MQLEKKWLFVLAVLVALGASATETAAQDLVTSSTLFAVVNSNGTLDRSNGVTGSVQLGTGIYEIGFIQKLNRCAFQGQMGQPGASGLGTPGEITINRRAGNARAIFVETYNSAGSTANRNFVVQVNCDRPR